METQTRIRFGILGCANIARKVSRAINLSPNATLQAIGSRSETKAQIFASQNEFPPQSKTYGSYDAVLDDPEVDAVYIPLPTSLHATWAIRAARKGKHVLLEKPVALNMSELDQILEACESCGVQFMDGTMWAHHPRTSKMRDLMDDPHSFGELKAMYSILTFGGNSEFLESDIRVKPDLDALGALGDIGWYCIRGLLWATNFQLPNTVIAQHGTVFNNSSVIVSCGASLHWEDGKVATFHCSFLSSLTMSLNLTGTKGTLTVQDFVIPFKEEEASFKLALKSELKDLSTRWDPLPSEHIITTELPQEALMVTEFARLVKSVKENGVRPEKKWPDISRKTQLVLNAVKESIDKGYEVIALSTN